MAERIELLLEAERRGILPPELAAPLAEAKRRGLVGAGAEEAPNPVAAFGQGVNEVLIDLADILGTSVAQAARAIGFDMEDRPIRRAVESGQKAVGGRFVTPGGGEAPGFGGAAGRMTGLSVAPGGAMFGAGARAATAAATAVPKGLPLKILEQIGEQVLRRPLTTAATETALAATAGIGGEAAARKFGEGARPTGEIAGGIAPVGIGAGVAAIGRGGVAVAERVPLGVGMATKAAKRGIQWLRENATKSGTVRRAEERFARVTRDVEAAKAELAGADVLPGISPAAKTGDLGLMSLEKAVMTSSQALRGKMDDYIGSMTQTIRSELASVRGEGTIAATRETMQEARAHLARLMEARLAIARQRSAERIEGLGPKASREQSNRIMREEIDKALADATAQKQELWNAVPRSIWTPTRASEGAYEDIVASTAKAQQKDIPEVAHRFFGPHKIEWESTVHEMEGLRSELLAVARKARSAGDFNQARLADEMAEAVLRDMGATRDEVVGETGERLRAALDYTKDFHDRFTRGPVGQILGFAREGGAATPAGLTLERTGLRGPKGREELDALLRATAKTGDQPAVFAAAEDFMKNRFFEDAVRDGAVLQTQARTFLKNYGEVLNRMPDLKAALQSAIEAGKVEIGLVTRQKATWTRLSDPNVSKSALFLGKEPGKEIARAFNSTDPGAVMGEIVRQARRDSTGKALAGLKSAAIEHFLTRALPRGASLEGLPSGEQMLADLADPKVSAALRKVLNPADMSRLKRIANTARRVEQQLKAQPDPEGVVKTGPLEFVSLGVRLLAAAIGRKIAAMTGGGTVQAPGIMVERAKTAMNRLTVDPTARLIVDAVQDEALFRALMTGEAAAPPQVERARQRLNAWAMGVVEDIGLDLAAGAEE